MEILTLSRALPTGSPAACLPCPYNTQIPCRKGRANMTRYCDTVFVWRGLAYNCVGSLRYPPAGPP
eukprot:2696082-Prymnesium_polylepis.1